jgi:hypothetical protein
LRYCAISRKVAGLIPSGGMGIFHWCNPDRTTALGWTQLLTNEYRGWRRPVRGAYNLHVPIVEKFWEPQPLGAVRACPRLYSDSFTARKWGASCTPVEGDAGTLWIEGFVGPQRKSWRGGEEILAAGSDRKSAFRVNQSLYRLGWRVSVLKVVGTFLFLDLSVVWTKILQVCLLKHKKSNPTTS